MQTPETSPSSSGRFAGRVVIITGASRGIGLAIAHRVVAEGGSVTITGRTESALTEAVAALGERALAVPGKADDPAHQQDTVARTADRFGGLDVMINNTGINPAYGPLSEIDEGVAAKIMAVNVVGALQWTRTAVGAGLGSRPGAAVVNMASVAGLGPAPGIAFYGVSKAALIGLTVQLAAELSPAVRVNAIAPAVVKTRFAAALYENDEEAAASAYPLGRLGRPEDIAAAAAFLASADADWITGQTLVVDGGLSLRATL